MTKGKRTIFGICLIVVMCGAGAAVGIELWVHHETMRALGEYRSGVRECLNEEARIEEFKMTMAYVRPSLLPVPGAPCQFWYIFGQGRSPFRSEIVSEMTKGVPEKAKSSLSDFSRFVDRGIENCPDLESSELFFWHVASSSPYYKYAHYVLYDEDTQEGWVFFIGN